VLVLTTIAIAVVAACGQDKSGPKTGSNSNWLVACVDAAECGEAGACLCGACSRECSDDSDCAGLDNAHCSTSDQTAAATLCGGPSDGAGLCLPRCSPGSCRSGQSCVDGGCVLSEMPDSEFCAPAREPTADAQLNEDELITLIQMNRVAGTVACDSGENVAAAPPLQLDGQLRCAARIKALDQDSTGVSGLTDSLGRDAPERIDLAGYNLSSWWESYAFSASSASQAYQILMADADSCPELGNGDYTAVAVGNAGDVYVVTLASD
jgi:hypothetical protein